MEGLQILSFRRTRRRGFIIVPLTLFALCACGGGGSSTPAAIPSTTPATPTPVPNPTAAGDTFAYAGSLTQTFTVYGTPGPAPTSGASPAPTATPWVSTSSQTVSQNVAVSTGQSFGGQNGLADLTTKETDAAALKTTTVTSQTYFSYAQDSSRANGLDVTEFGTSSTDSNGVSLQSTIGSGNGIVQELPSVPGAQWTNGATRTDTEKDPDGQTSTSTYAADGSYQEQVNYTGGGTASVQENADGSAVYQLPVLGLTNTNSTVTVNPPAGGQIDVAVVAQGIGIRPTSIGLTIPVWYPQTPPLLTSDSFVDEGSTTVPSSCKAAGIYAGVTVEQIVETKNRVDTVFGEYESEKTTQYISPSYGLLCAVVNDDLKSYYDYSGQSGGLFAFSPTPLLETLITESLALQSEQQVTTSSVSHRATQSSSPHIAARPSFARARMILATARAQHIRAFAAHLRSNSNTRQPQ